MTIFIRPCTPAVFGRPQARSRVSIFCFAYLSRTVPLGIIFILLTEWWSRRNVHPKTIGVRLDSRGVQDRSEKHKHPPPTQVRRCSRRRRRRRRRGDALASSLQKLCPQSERSRNNMNMPFAPGNRPTRAGRACRIWPTHPSLRPYHPCHAKTARCLSPVAGPRAGEPCPRW